MGGDGTDFGYQVGDAATFGMASKGRQKTKQKEMEIEAQAASEERAATKAAADAEAAKIAKQKEDEDALVRRNMLTAAVKQRLSGRSASNTRLSSATV